MKHYPGYLFYRFAIFVFRWLPFTFIYKLSDALSAIIYYLLPYRKKMVIQNLSQCFPKKSPADIRQLTREFYRHFTDILLESFKGASLSNAEMVKRYTITNPEVTNAYYRQGKSVIVVGGHYANWEWGICVGLQVEHLPLIIYRPIRNTLINQHFQRSRGSKGLKLVPIRQTAAAFEQYKNERVGYIMMADQSPTGAMMPQAFWVHFLNRETPCVYGPEKYAKRTKYPVLYFDVQRVKRGYYTLTFVPMFDDPSKTEATEITRKYMEMLETIIQKKPQDWLWSHNRWKRGR